MLFIDCRAKENRRKSIQALPSFFHYYSHFLENCFYLLLLFQSNSLVIFSRGCKKFEGEYLKLISDGISVEIWRRSNAHTAFFFSRADISAVHVTFTSKKTIFGLIVTNKKRNEFLHCCKEDL